MERELERLLTGTTPPTPLPDIEALHRRGARRRMAVRLSASAVVAVVAMGALAVQGALAPDTIEFGPADQADGDVEPPDTSQGGGDERGDDRASDAGAPEDENEAEPPFGLSPEEIAEAADALPDHGLEAQPDDVEAVLGTDLGENPNLRTEFVDCYYQGADGDTADTPEDARDRAERFGEEMTTADLIGECLDSDWLRGGEGSAPGPFTVCQGHRLAADRKSAIEQDTSNGWQVHDDSDLDPVPFAVLLSWEEACADAEPEGNWDVALSDEPPMDTLNDNRRVELATKALERSCLTYREALAFGVATSDRLEGDWRVLGLDADTPRPRPCSGLEFDGEWGTIMVTPSAYWDRNVPVPEPLEADDPRRDSALGEALKDALKAGDARGAAEAVDRVAPLNGRTLSGALRQARGQGGRDERELGSRVVSALTGAMDLGCLEESSAITLALTLHDALATHDDRDWFVGAVAIEDVTDPDVDQSEPTCFRLDVASTASFSEDADPDPAIVVEPLWID